MPKPKGHKAEIDRYVRGVLAGKIVAGRLVRDACQRHLDDLKAAKRKKIKFDQELADRAIDFFPLLKHTTGEYAGEPFVLKPFQKFIVAMIFGWRRAADGMRRFRRVLISLGRGNGKSPFAAALTLLCFAFDTPLEARAECYTFATDVTQARIVFDEVARYIDNDPRLHGYVERLKQNLSIPANGSFLRPLSKVPRDGLIPHLVTVDEFHEWKDQHRPQWDKVLTAMGKRRQPLLLVITTAGDDHSDLWKEFDNLATQAVERGNSVEIDDLFAFIARIDDDDDPLDEANWAKANPLLEFGVVKVEHLRSMAHDAAVDPLAKQRLTRYHCNRRVSSSTRAITAEMWATGGGPLPDLTGRQCRAGFDWGWKDDLAAIGYVFPLEPVEIDGEQKRRVAVIVDVWIPDSGKRNLALEPWASWIRDGWLRVTAGKITDTEAIYARFRERQKTFGIGTLAADPNNCREFGTKIQNELGIDAFWFGQTFGKFNEPTRELLSMMHEGRFLHGDNPLLCWAFHNMVLRTDHRGYAMPDKERSQDKIDPAVTVIMGLSEVLFAETEVVPSYYDTHEVESA